MTTGILDDSVVDYPNLRVARSKIDKQWAILRLHAFSRCFSPKQIVTKNLPISATLWGLNDSEHFVHVSYVVSTPRC